MIGHRDTLNFGDCLGRKCLSKDVSCQTITTPYETKLKLDIKI